MIFAADFSLIEAIFRRPNKYQKQPTESGLDGLPELIRAELKEVRHIDQDNHLQTRRI